MDAIVLAGGLGTRLREVVPDLPKPLAPIRGKPFLDHLLHQLTGFKQITRVIAAVGYKGEDIIQYYKKHPAPLPLVFSIEETPLGTGGAAKRAFEQAVGDTVLVLNGDSFFEIDFQKFLDCHLASHADVTLACLEVPDAGRYGSVEIDSATGRILSFREKSPHAGKGWINGGLYLFETKAAMAFPSADCFSLEKEFFPSLFSKYAFLSTGCFIDIGTKESFFAAERHLQGVL